MNQQKEVSGSKMKASQQVLLAEDEWMMDLKHKWINRQIWLIYSRSSGFIALSIDMSN